MDNSIKKDINLIGVGAILSIVAAAAGIIAVVMRMLMGKFLSTKELFVSADMTSGYLLGLSTIAGVLAFILSVAGIVKAAKANDAFKPALKYVVFDFVFGVFAAIFVGNPIVDFCFPIANAIFTYLIITSVTDALASVLGTDKSEIFSKTKQNIMILFLTMIVLNIAAALINIILKAVAIELAISFIAVPIVAIAAYVLYFMALHKAKTME